jgi:phosphoribosylaminoimidazole-succinocarboxamide synthase
VRLLGQGKVRDVYEVDEELILIVASDRISAYDFVLSTPIPDKGRVLTALTVWWLEQLADVVPNHLVTVEDPRIPAKWRGRAMLCRRLEMVPIECVARGYLAGSATAEYLASGRVCGIPLPPGLREGDELPSPLFTPATKASEGHDENITLEQAAELVGDGVAAELAELTLQVYSTALPLAAGRGILLADTKLEFGFRPGTDELLLGDEVLTPDSSRFWPAADWSPGRSQPSYDKQFVRDWLAKESGWDRNSPPPPLPDAVVSGTRERYVEAYERLTGRAFADWPGAALG